MKPREVLDNALAYRNGDRLLTRLDLQAAQEHPRCKSCHRRFGTNDLVLLRRALDLLG